MSDSYECENCGTTIKPVEIYPHCKITDTEYGEIYDEEICIIMCPECHLFKFGDMV